MLVLDEFYDVMVTNINVFLSAVFDAFLRHEYGSFVIIEDTRGILANVWSGSGRLGYVRKHL